MIYLNPNLRSSYRDGYVIATFICDTAAELPALNYIADYTLEIGSTAHVIENATDYEMQSDGTWCIARTSDLQTLVTSISNLESEMTDAQTDIGTLQTLTGELRAAAVRLVDNGAKNIILFDGVGTSAANAGTSYTSNGITFDVQTNGTIRVHGTIPTGNSYCYLYTGTVRTNVISGFDGEHVLSGNPEGSSVETYRMWYKVGTQASVSEPTNGVILPDQPGETTAVLGLQVNAPQTDLDVVFSPMICPEIFWKFSEKYGPYAPTNAELYALIKSYHP